MMRWISLTSLKTIKINAGNSERYAVNGEIIKQINTAQNDSYHFTFVTLMVKKSFFKYNYTGYF